MNARELIKEIRAQLKAHNLPDTTQVWVQGSPEGDHSYCYSADVIMVSGKKVLCFNAYDFDKVKP